MSPIAIDPCAQPERASALQQQTGYPLLDEAPNAAYRLRCLDKGLALWQGSEERIYLDFGGGKTQHRQQFGGGKKQPLARALGLGKQQPWHIVDATAGLGQDAYVLASLGAKMILVEQSAVVHALLQDALARGRIHPGSAEVCARMQLHHAPSHQYLRHLSHPPDAIYIDPMYPTKGKSAAAKKGMQTLKAILGVDSTGAEVLAAALASGCKRIAVKRPKGAPFLAEKAPVGSVQSPNTRYDLYTA